MPWIKWKAEEVEYLVKNYSSTPNYILLENLPGRTKTSIYKKARKLNLTADSSKRFNDRSYSKRREKSSNWKGGIRKTKRGYIMLLIPGHHRSDKNGYVFEHIVVWERANNSFLPDGYCVHHKNGIKNDNRPENLVALKNGDHTALHNKSRVLSEETKLKISKKAKERFSRKENHPFFKSWINIEDIENEISSGLTILQACNKFGISKSTYYSRKRDKQNA